MRLWTTQVAEKAFKQLIRFFLDQGYQAWAIEALCTLTLDEEIRERRKRLPSRGGE